MSFFLTSFQTELMRRLKQKRTWLLILLLPIVVLAAVRLIPAEEAAAPVQVGVVIPDGDEAGEELMERLTLRSGAVVTFLETDEELARKNVAAANWDCALLLDEDFAQRLDELDTRRLITLIIGDASVAYPVVQETVAACLTELAAPKMAEEYLLESGIITEEALDAQSDLLTEKLGADRQVMIQLETLEGEKLERATLGKRGLNEVLSGVITILLVIWVMFVAMDLGVWLKSPFAQRLRALQPATILLLPRMAAALCPALLSGAIASLFLNTPIRRAVALLPFLLLLGVLALLCARSKAVWGAFPVLMPFVPVLCLLLSPILFDVSALFPVISPLSACMPITLYLRTVEGSMGAALIQVGVAVVLVLLVALADRFLRKGSKAISTH